MIRHEPPKQLEMPTRSELCLSSPDDTDYSAADVTMRRNIWHKRPIVIDLLFDGAGADTEIRVLWKRNEMELLSSQHLNDDRRPVSVVRLSPSSDDLLQEDAVLFSSPDSLQMFAMKIAENSQDPSRELRQSIMVSCRCNCVYSASRMLYDVRITCCVHRRRTSKGCAIPIDFLSQP